VSTHRHPPWPSGSVLGASQITVTTVVLHSLSSASYSCPSGHAHEFLDGPFHARGCWQEHSVRPGAALSEPPSHFSQGPWPVTLNDPRRQRQGPSPSAVLCEKAGHDSGMLTQFLPWRLWSGPQGAKHSSSISSWLAGQAQSALPSSARTNEGRQTQTLPSGISLSPKHCVTVSCCSSHELVACCCCCLLGCVERFREGGGGREEEELFEMGCFFLEERGKGGLGGREDAQAGCLFGPGPKPKREKQQNAPGYTFGPQGNRK
jgi:hypothetical protein